MTERDAAYVACNSFMRAAGDVVDYHPEPEEFFKLWYEQLLPIELEVGKEIKAKREAG